MAVVKMKQIKTTLHKSIAYVTDPAKTRGGELASSNYADDVSDAVLLADRMLATIDSTPNGRRKDGVLAHHVIQSFSHGDSRRLGPAKLHAIGVEFADEITGGAHQYVIATHVDREHTHNHIIICAASQLTRRKMRVTKDTLASWRAVSDRLCREHGLDVLPERRPDRRRYGASLAELYASAKGDAVKDRIRTAVDLAAGAADGFETFARILPEHGVRVSVRGTHLTFLDVTTGMRVRDVRLGRAYDETNIMARIGRVTVLPISFNRSMIAESGDGMMRVWMPGTRRRKSVAIPETCVVGDGVTYRAYLSSTAPVTVMDRHGGHARRTDAFSLYEHFSRLPVRALPLAGTLVPATLGKSEAQHRWHEMQAARFDRLDDLAAQLNTASRLARDGVGVDDAIRDADRRLMQEHDAFQAMLIALDDEATAHGGTPPADMVEELRWREARVETASRELDVLHRIRDGLSEETGIERGGTRTRGARRMEGGGR